MSSVTEQPPGGVWIYDKAQQRPYTDKGIENNWHGNCYLQAKLCKETGRPITDMIMVARQFKVRGSKRNLCA